MPVAPGRFHRSRTKSVGLYTAYFGLIRAQEPLLTGFTANEATLPIKFTYRSHISMGNGRRRYSLWRDFFYVQMTVLMPILSVLLFNARFTG